jgi:putative protease
MELLLPAGSPEAVYAAIEGGADAIYLGLDRFNARGRAKNFTRTQLLQALYLARTSNVKIYLTLNTLVKNEELADLIELVSFLNQTGIDALIVQDWGVYWVLKNFFPSLIIHASTQMGIHNSYGAIIAEQYGFSRIVIARELTLQEVKAISKASSVQVEVFIHGALCYCFSGSCLFSSWVGGMSANRGMCRQPCRRLFSINQANERQAVFSLSDLQLANQIENLKQAGVTSLKVEGRMKPAEYVYRVAKAYRLILDSPERSDEAKQILESDYARDKTEYFFGQAISGAISSQTFAGKYAGTVTGCADEWLELETVETLNVGDRLRVQPISGVDTQAIKVETIEVLDQTGMLVRIYPKDLTQKYGIMKGDKVFIIGTNRAKFPSRFKDKDFVSRIRTLSDGLVRNLRQRIMQSVRRVPERDEIIIRVDSIAWLAKIHTDAVDAVILDLSLDEIDKLDFARPNMIKNIDKFIISLPFFIQEKNIPKWKAVVARLHSHGCATFILHQVWQIPFVTGLNNIGIWLSENSYSMNDAAITLYQEIGIERYILPYENDANNLLGYEHKDGIVPLYYKPRVFVSRMPAMKNTDICSDSTGTYEYSIKDGISMLVPQIPVSLLHKRDELMQQGFRRYLIDLSFEKPSGNTFNRLLKAYHARTPVQPSSVFNYKSGLH